MVRKFELKPMLVSFLVSIFVIGSSLIAYANEPPPGTEVTGRRTDAVLTVVTIHIENASFVAASIIGECNGEPFVFGPLVDNPISSENINDVTEANLENQYLENIDSAGCYEALGTDDLVIIGVRNLINTGTAVTADIVLRAVVPGF